MESPATAVVRICGYPRNFALARAFEKFQAMASLRQTLDAFVDVMHVHIMEESVYDPNMQFLFLDHMGELDVSTGWHRHACNSVWNITEEDGEVILSSMTTVMKIIQHREYRQYIPRAMLSRKGTATLKSCKQSTAKEWCIVPSR